MVDEVTFETGRTGTWGATHQFSFSANFMKKVGRFSVQAAPLAILPNLTRVTEILKLVIGRGRLPVTALAALSYTRLLL